MKQSVPAVRDKLKPGRNYFRIVILCLAIAALVFMGGRLYRTYTGNVRNPGSYLVLVNKQFFLPKNYAPGDLVVPAVKFEKEVTSQEKKLRKEAAAALEALFKEAENNGLTLYCESGYRPYDMQKQIYDRIRKEQGREYAAQYVALPGKSEHQTGLAMDVIQVSDSKTVKGQDFGSTKEGRWLRENASRFGFILRYPQGKSDITGYHYEPWHIRYVGIKAAEDIYKRKLTLEEYLGNA